MDLITYVSKGLVKGLLLPKFFAAARLSLAVRFFLKSKRLTETAAGAAKGMCLQNKPHPWDRSFCSSVPLPKYVCLASWQDGEAGTPGKCCTRKMMKSENPKSLKSCAAQSRDIWSE